MSTEHRRVEKKVRLEGNFFHRAISNPSSASQPTLYRSQMMGHSGSALKASLGDTIALPPHPLHRSVLSQDSFQLRSSAPANSLSLHTHPHCLESLASRRGIPSPPQASPAAIFQSEDPSKLPPPAPLDLSGCQPPSAIPYSPPFLWKIAPAAGVLRINPASQALHPPPSSNTFEGRPYWDSQHAFSQQQVLSEFPPAAYSTKETPFHRSSFISLNHPLHSPLVNPQQQPLLNQQWGGPREGPRGGPREGLLESSRWVQSASNHAAPPGGGRLAAPAGARPIASTDPRLFRAGPEILGLAESKPLLIRPLDPNSSALENLGQNLALENLGQSFAPGALQRPPVMPPLRLLGPRNSPPFPPANPTANSPTNPQGLPWLAPRAAQSRRCALARPEPLLSGIGVNRPGQTSSVAQAPAQTLAPTTTLAPTLSPIPAPGSTSTPDLAPVSPAVSGGAEESSGGGSRPWPYQGAASQPAPSLSPDGAGTSESGSEEPDFSSDPSWLPPGLGKPAAVGGGALETKSRPLTHLGLRKIKKPVRDCCEGANCRAIVWPSCDYHLAPDAARPETPQEIPYRCNTCHTYRKRQLRGGNKLSVGAVGGSVVGAGGSVGGVGQFQGGAGQGENKRNKRSSSASLSVPSHSVPPLSVSPLGEKRSEVLQAAEGLLGLKELP